LNRSRPETLPYDLFSPHPDIVSQRLRMLSVLPRLTKGVVIVDLETLLQRLAPQTYIDAHAFDLSVGETIDLEQFALARAAPGYVASSQVMAPGEFAVRSSLIDLFPMKSDARIDLFDRDVESIHISSETQRSGDKVKRCAYCRPAVPLTAEGIPAFKRRFLIFPGDLTRMQVYQEIAEGAPPQASILPALFFRVATLFDFLPQNARRR
jgi:transcription-repair coupling factor (superfamily II helicase)